MATTEPRCKWCKSRVLRKKGIEYQASGTKQRYKCLKCQRYTLVEEAGE